MPWSCVRGARLQVRGVGAGAGSCFPPWAPPFPRVPQGACCESSRPVVPSFCLPVRSSMGSVRSAGSVWSPLTSAPRVCRVWVRSCSRGVRAPPARVRVARALRAILVQDAGRAVPGGSCPSAFPAPVPCPAYFAPGGWPGPFVPFHGLGSLAPLQTGLPLRAGFPRSGGGTRAPRGGGASCLGLRRPGLGALQRPKARPSGVRSGPATHWLWVREVWT